jgi:penicillin G amidase
MIWFRRLFLLFMLFAVLAGGALWLLLRSSLPQTTGTLPLPGLTAPVAVVRDELGVPTLRAQNTHDLYMALGFVHAQDRLFQMDLQRRMSQGRLAEIFGGEALGSDRAMRTLGLYRHAVAGLRFVSPDFEAVLDAYAEGVNAFIASGKALPVEFTLLRYRPDPWRPADTLVIGKLLALQLSGNYRHELLRARLAQTLSAEELHELFPGYPQDAPVALGRLAALTRDLPLDRLLAALPEVVGPQRASNNWVVDGDHSASGKPLLANDPHLDYAAPLVWYLTRLEAPGLTLVGATMAGAPVIILGHNARIAWGYSTTGADVEDVFVEQSDPNDASRYLTPDGPVPFEVIDEEIPIKGQAAEPFKIRITRHGPVLSDQAGTAPTEAGRFMALQASFLVDDDRSVEAQWRATLASDWRSWVDAFSLFTAPVQNMVYGDIDGNIGFFAPGHIPIRQDGDGRAPVPGWTGAYDWKGFVPFAELPRAFNPPSGHFATANNKIVPDTYPYLITYDWELPYRIERIEAGLAETPKQSIESSTRLQADIVSLSAKHLLPLMLKAEPRDERARIAVSLLASWDGQMASERAEPLIFVAWLRALNKHLFQSALGSNFERYWGMTPRATEGVLTRHPHWCGSVGCMVVIRSALEDALEELTAAYGPDPTAWHWGAAHPALFAHPIFDRIPLLRDLFDRRLPADGSSDTVNAGAFRFSNPKGAYVDTHGPALRAIYDLSDLDRSVFLTALGQSAHILSPHYADLLPRWREFQWLRLPHSAQGQTLWLVPKSVTVLRAGQRG